MTPSTFNLSRAMRRGVALSISFATLVAPGWVAAETIGGGTITTPAVGPAPAYAVDGSGFALVKNWDFGTSATSTVRDMATMNTHFQYHDQHGLDANPGYGASMVAPNAATAISGQPIEGVDTTSPVRAFFPETLRTYLVPLNGATLLDPYLLNTGSGAFQPRWTLSGGGTRLEQDVLWETRVRYVVPRYFWFALWTDGDSWDEGAEYDLIESFGYDNAAIRGGNNFDGRYWHSSVVGGSSVTNYHVNWANGMTANGIPAYLAPVYNPTEWHVWTWLYRKDNTYAAFVDGVQVQSGTIHWTFGGGATDRPVNMSFHFDGTWGSRKPETRNDFTLPASELAGKYYEWDYSRVYLRTEPVKDNTDTTGITITAGTSAWVANSTPTGYVGTNYLHDNNTDKGIKSVRYTPTLSESGTYNVYMRWPSGGSGRAASVPVDIVKADGTTTTVPVNQTVNGGTWNLLGTYALSKRNASVTIRTTGTRGTVIADAVRFTPIANEVIVDNSRLSSSDKTGTWVHSRSTPGFHGYNYVHDNNDGKGSATATFTPDLPVAGTYNVYARWTASESRSNNVPYRITSKAGSAVVYRNQRVNGGAWQLLGTYPFNAGTGGNVVISNAGTSGHVVADAVRFELVRP
ncbi:golvesin C-terminal-like domain-containing protein [Pyxidicoccus xibeiensis]|uniref:golvesin C-terminal-like domain-containing protein n=1 Tax=Pyxidicoccus xibeiensis TaxID=2906759 RepID=UPI0020A75F7E|nr:hypothetical protein [Pyxidicoccus xibeiensis]MCP3138585.1 hypothetical protein [Pyxidicoccus xibeiensis]